MGNHPQKRRTRVRGSRPRGGRGSLASNGSGGNNSLNNHWARRSQCGRGEATAYRLWKELFPPEANNTCHSSRRAAR